MDSSVDPETLYTKQNCIGKTTYAHIPIGLNGRLIEGRWRKLRKGLQRVGTYYLDLCTLTC